MHIPNPFFLLHSTTLKWHTKLSWSCTYHRDITAPDLAFVSMIAGLSLCVAGVALVEPFAVWFIGGVVALPFMVRRDIHRQYEHNTKNGCQNALQINWPHMVSLHCLMILLVVSTLMVPGQEGVAARVMAIGVYVFLIPPLYFLATDRMPPGYRPRTRAVSIQSA